MTPEETKAIVVAFEIIETAGKIAKLIADDKPEEAAAESRRAYVALDALMKTPASEIDRKVLR